MAVLGTMSFARDVALLSISSWSMMESLTMVAFIDLIAPLCES